MHISEATIVRFHRGAAVFFVSLLLLGFSVKMGFDGKYQAYDSVKSWAQVMSRLDSLVIRSLMLAGFAAAWPVRGR